MTRTEHVTTGGMRMLQVFLATEASWCTIYTADSLPDFAAIQEAYPQVTIYDVRELHGETIASAQKCTC